MNRHLCLLALTLSFAGVCHAQDLPLTLIIDAEITAESLLDDNPFLSENGIDIGASYQATIQLEELVETSNEATVSAHEYNGAISVNVGDFAFESSSGSINLLHSQGQSLFLDALVTSADGDDLLIGLEAFTLNADTTSVVGTDVFALFAEPANVDELAHLLDLSNIVEGGSLVEIRPTSVTLVPEPNGALWFGLLLGSAVLAFRHCDRLKVE